MAVRSPAPPGPRDIILIACCFGLATGLVEGIGFVLLQGQHWLSWTRAKQPVALEIIWVAPLFDLVLFALVGTALGGIKRILPRFPLPLNAIMSLFAFLTFYGWFELSGHLYRYSVVLMALGCAVALGRWVQSDADVALRLCRRALPALCVATILLCAGITEGERIREAIASSRLPPAPAGSPNIVLIVVDTLRADHISADGYSRATTPNIDNAARNGVSFDNAYATSSWTLPSHASLVTGRYPYEHGAEKDFLDARYPTIGEALRSRGYRTGAFSGNMYFFNRYRGFGRGFLHFDDYFDSLADATVRTVFGREFQRYLLPFTGIEDLVGRKRAPQVNRSALNWIDRDRARPFFIFLNYFDVHDPYLPPEPYRHRFSTVEYPGGLLNQDAGRSYVQLSPEQVQGEIDAYDGAIAYTDFHIGQLLHALEARDLHTRTIVIITSDHGESLGEHGLFLHQNALYRELIRVPLIIAGPGVVPQGTRVGVPVSNAALPTTIMDLIGAAKDAPFPHASLVPLWQASDSAGPWPAPLAELAHFPFGDPRRPSFHGAMRSLVDADWHYIVNEKLPPELYDAHDIAERNNLVDTPTARSVVQDFNRDLAARRATRAQSLSAATETQDVARR